MAIQKSEQQRPRLICAALEGLSPGEQIAWEGRPLWSRFLISEVRNNFFVLLFCVAAFFLLRELWIIAIFFVMSAIFFLADRMRWKNTYYVITSNRVIILSGGIIRKEVKSTFYRDLTGAFLKVGILDRIVRTGTIRLAFNNLNPVFMAQATQRGRNQGHTGRAAELGELKFVPDVSSVHSTIQSMIHQNSPEMQPPIPMQQAPQPAANQRSCGSCGALVSARFCGECGAQS